MCTHNITTRRHTYAMEFILAKEALLPEGWVHDVRVGIGLDGRIASVERTTEHTTGVCEQNDHVVSTLLPAPVNVHSHAFQRAMAGLTEKRGQGSCYTFWTWRKLMYSFLDQLTPDQIEAITAFVQMEMLETGYATNVEFHYVHHQPGGMAYDNLVELSERIVAATQTSGIGLTLLPVHYQFGGCDQRALSREQRRFGTNLDTYSTLWTEARRLLNQLPGDARLGVSAHSLRAVSPDSFVPLQSLESAVPFHMHLAEQEQEVAEVLAMWGARPVEWLLENVAVNKHWCLIHCTQMLSHETISLAQSGAVVGLCPITESSLGDGIFDGVNFVGSGGRFAIGSDANVRISLSEELRTLDYSQRLRDHSRAAFATQQQSSGRRLFDAVVAGGAQAAGRRSGLIEVGQWADLMVLDSEHLDLEGVNGDTVLDTFIFSGDDRMVIDVWSAGRHLVAQGQHIHRATIVDRYRGVMKTLKEAL